MADWPPFGRAISNAPNTQQHPTIATDGAGGAIVVWQDLRDPRINVFAQHVTAFGDLDPAWPGNGRALLTDSLAIEAGAGGQVSPAIVPDGAGGAIVAWQDLRTEANDIDLFAQHVLASGAVDARWPANGAALCVNAGNQNTHVMATDGAGGAIVAWVDARAGVDVPDIFAQHVLASGVVDPRWPANGFPVCVAAGPQGFPAIVADGAGGAIVTWHDDRPGSLGFDVYALRVTAAGTVAAGWPLNGRAVCTVAGDQGRPTITEDGAHGAVVAWTDGRVTGTDHIFAHHVLAGGSLDPAWPAGGLAISNAGFLESRPLAIPDGAGGAIVTWQALSIHLNLYAQRVRANGTVDPAWPAGGRALSITPRQQTGASIVTDGTGGAVVAWQDSSDIMAQHVFASGVLDPAYPDTGRAVCNLPSAQGGVALVATGGGGAIATWTDGRKTTDVDVFALQVLAAATVSVPPESPVAIALARPVPNPARVALALRLTLPRESRVRLAIYDVTGRRVRNLVSGFRPAGETKVDWNLRDDSGRAVDTGLYFARLEVEGRTFVEKITALR
jgi:hypothetical protein